MSKYAPFDDKEICREKMVEMNDTFSSDRQMGSDKRKCLQLAPVRDPKYPNIRGRMYPWGEVMEKLRAAIQRHRAKRGR